MGPRPLVACRGFVVSIDEHGAFVRLVDDEGREYAGLYPAAELAAAGVGEGEPFQLTAVEDGDAVRFEIRPLPRRRMTAKELAAIHRRIEEEFKDFSPEDDY